MKPIFIYFLLILSIMTHAQRPLDTIYANDQMNVALFFPKQIRQAITGAENFAFTYNRDNGQYFGLLQAKPGKESNLLTVTNDGKVYSYIIKYAEKLLELNYFISENESIGYEFSMDFELEPVAGTQDEYAKNETHFQKMGDHLLNSRYENLATKRKKGIKIQLQKMVYDASEVYLVLQVQNRSGIDFEIDFLKVYRTNGNKNRKTSYQRLLQKVIYKYEMPDAVLKGQFQRFVFVLPKFVLGDNEKLMMELKEQKGGRKIILEKVLTQL
ncbi:MAG: conjugal transfer protein [Flavobacteriales bacterium 32-35-8]|nr:MAG: conjugal transfer protein [Flavobacteriales bacterium 32-35-8]